MKTAARRAVALTAGVLCHGSFLLAVLWMGASLYTGMRLGLGRLHGVCAWSRNALLLLQFPLLHSFLLSRPGARWLSVLAPRRCARALAPTSFATLAALQVLATFALWSPSGRVWWQPSGAWLVLGTLAFALSWLFLGLSLLHAGLGLQTGWIGWRVVWRARDPVYPGMPTAGTFRLCRQPIYLGFALVLWTGPAWSPDHLAIALVWSVYCFLGPVRKERRFALRYGPAFQEYRARVPYIVPRIPT